jgi:hypothetical protein
MRGPDPEGLIEFLGEHTPFQSMSPDELAELAAGSVRVEFAADAVIADGLRRTRHAPGQR